MSTVDPAGFGVSGVVNYIGELMVKGAGGVEVPG